MRRWGPRSHAPHSRDMGAEPRSSRTSGSLAAARGPRTRHLGPPCARCHLAASPLGPRAERASHSRAHRLRSTLVWPRTKQWPAEPWVGGAVPVVGGEAGCQGYGALSPPWALRCVDGARPPGTGRQGEGPGLVILSVHADAPSACDPSAYTAARSPSPLPWPCPQMGRWKGGGALSVLRL